MVFPLVISILLSCGPLRRLPGLLYSPCPVTIGTVCQNKAVTSPWGVPLTNSPLIGVRDNDLFCEKKTDPLEFRRRIRMVSQKPNPFPRSVFENVAYSPRIHGVKDRDMLARIVERSLKKRQPSGKRYGTGSKERRDRRIRIGLHEKRKEPLRYLHEKRVSGAERNLSAINLQTLLLAGRYFAVMSM